MKRRKRQNENKSILVDFALRLVMKEDGRYSLPESSTPALATAIGCMFGQSTLDPKDELEALMRLGLLFQSKHNAYDVADRILDAIAKDDRALCALGIASGRKARELRKRFAALTGESGPVTAPVFGQSAPKGAVKASSFLEPSREARRAKPAKVPHRRPGLERSTTADKTDAPKVSRRAVRTGGGAQRRRRFTTA